MVLERKVQETGDGDERVLLILWRGWEKRWRPQVHMRDGGEEEGPHCGRDLAQPQLNTKPVQNIPEAKPRHHIHRVKRQAVDPPSLGIPCKGGEWVWECGGGGPRHREEDLERNTKPLREVEVGEGGRV